MNINYREGFFCVALLGNEGPQSVIGLYHMRIIQHAIEANHGTIQFYKDAQCQVLYIRNKMTLLVWYHVSLCLYKGEIGFNPLTQNNINNLFYFSYPQHR